MIFINHMKSAKAAKDYYSQHIAPGDYYTKDAAESVGVWHGHAADMLGLSGEVNKDDVFALCDNRDPQTGEQLTPRMKDDRRVLTDLTFDVPKSVTLAFELGGDDRIMGAFRESVRETMNEIEESVQTRVRTKGRDENRMTGNMVWAEHIHRTTRPVEGKPDAQLHCHATIFNTTWDAAEDRWKAVQLGDIVRDKFYYQSAFHARLAGKLKEMGYGIEKDGHSFTLAGISRATVEKFSRRTAVIEAEAQRLGMDDASAKSKLGRKTREKKASFPDPMADLRKEWQARLTEDEQLAVKTAGAGLVKGDDSITPEQAKEYALEHSFQNASTVSEKRLKAEALAYSVGSVLPEGVADISQHPEVIAETRGGQLMTTTKTVLRDEIAMLQFAKDGQRKHGSFWVNSTGKKDKEFNVIGNESGYNPPTSENAQEMLAGLSAEQRKAALHILTSRDTVTGVVGKAGTGKTRMMRATVDALQSVQSNRVSVFAPSSQARDVLKKEGFSEAKTLATLLKNKHLQEETKGSVLWVDEAGLVSSDDMRQLMDVAKRNGNRVILSGDYTQHSSVEAGDAFRLLEQEAGVKLARLTEIRRQTEPGYKKAVEQVSQGTGKAAQKGFDSLDRMGWITEASGPERHSLLVADYLNAFEDGKSALIIAPTHSEGAKITDELRRAMKQRGALGAERDFKVRRSTGWTDAQKGDIRNYEPGMVVEFSQNAKGFARAEKTVVGQDDGGVYLQKTDGLRSPLPLDQAQRFEVYRTHDIAIARGDRIRITKNGEAKIDGQPKGSRMNNGDIFTVEGFTKDGDIRLDKRKVLPRDWGHFNLGYVDTSYASQGKTVDRVLISVGEESLPAAGQQQWYVSTTRGREQARVYVDSKEDVRNAIAKTGERLSAVELTNTKLRDGWRSRMAQSIERNRVANFLKQRAAAIGNYWRGRKREGLGYA